MSPNHYPIFLVSQFDKPEQIKEKTRMLIQLYLKDPTPFIANAVSTHITALLDYPNYINDIQERCQFRKLEKHWHCLAWIDHKPLFTADKNTNMG